ncbi:uncharacterized protein EI90DRAFT_3118236 [Cantharellus anzutake]|uniref:uncharacterized protein n=1 Tax=Cantharellus anzutake TaxID=1750568 RepID=UPI0019089511|nr:uncharacterized protein EI90DRAFT_3118236 [Cantharellus anzutake]KAF8339150.1 hypothetical protein EI90DRAFT_3118236 [Cantharellus anzutake]
MPVPTSDLREKSPYDKVAWTFRSANEGGNLAAYGASDSSVGIVDAHVLSVRRGSEVQPGEVMLTYYVRMIADSHILKAHDFPPTTLQFNPSSTLLVSGSADASIRAIVVPPSFTSSSTLQICLLLIALFILVAAILIQR